MAPQISVVIPNYNGGDNLNRCLIAITQACMPSGLRYEIVVADDASPVPPPKELEQKFANLKIVEGKTNLGFSGNCNRGAQSTNSDLILFLNNDVFVSTDLVEKIFGQYMALEKSFPGKVFSIQPRIVFEDGEMADGGKFPYIPSLLCLSGLRSTLNFRARTFFTEPVPHLFSSGACMLVSKEKFLKLSGFDALYSPFYSEDVDLSLRAWRRDWMSFYFDGVSAIHKGSATIKTFVPDVVRATSKSNRILFHLRHLSCVDLIPWVFFQILSLLFLTLKNPRMTAMILKRIRAKLNLLNRAHQGPSSFRTVLNHIRGLIPKDVVRF